jgi:hypothetical protein
MVVLFAQKPLQISPRRVSPRFEVVVLVVVEAADVRANFLELNRQQPYCSLLRCLLIVHASILPQETRTAQQEIRRALS